MNKKAYYLVNAITLYRLIASAILILLVLNNNYEFFKWMLAISFFTDLIDGTLARYLKVTSIFGTRLDSLADDATIIAALAGMVKFKTDFLLNNYVVFLLLFALFIIQTAFALIKYRKITNFHTLLAKTAAIFQGIFLLQMFFSTAPNYLLFYAAVFITMLDLAEEIVLVGLLPSWKSNIRGIYWFLKSRKSAL
jgi:phosphatidylglycerophosphate synthase